MKEKTLEKIYWGVIIFLGGSAIFTSVGLLNSVMAGEEIVIHSGGLELSPRIFATQILFITLIDILVAVVAVLSLRNVQKLNSRKTD